SDGSTGSASVMLSLVIDASSMIGSYTARFTVPGITFYPGYGEDRRSVLQDPAVTRIADAHGKSPAQVLLRWGLQQGRSVIPKSTKRHRIAENIDVFDFDLAADELSALDALETGRRGGPEPENVTLADYGRAIPEA
ncbi:aldo/keto reductase, partial [Streptomyces sp. NPDC001443]